MNSNTTNTLIEINTPNWELALKDHSAIVEFWAPWCEPCKVQEPILESIVSEFPDLKFFKLNVDDNKYLSRELGVRNIPTIIIYKDLIEIHRFNSIQSREVLLKSINQFVNL